MSSSLAALTFASFANGIPDIIISSNNIKTDQNIELFTISSYSSLIFTGCFVVFLLIQNHPSTVTLPYYTF